jgi:hypothetical protein
MPSTPEIGAEVTHLVNDDPSDDYLMAAYRLLCSVNGTDQVARQYALVSCVSSFLSLEAAINRLYYDAFIRCDEMRRGIKASVPQAVSDFIRHSWARLSIKNKYLLLPPLLEPTDFSFCPSERPFTLFEEFIRFRNRLVHPTVVEHSYTILVTEVTKSSESSSSWGGDLLQKQSGAVPPKSIFPLTGFATSFGDLSALDAEKALEITVRMRLALSNGVYGPTPTLFYDADGKLSVKMGASVGTILKLHFGELNEKDI